MLLQEPLHTILSFVKPEMHEESDGKLKAGDLGPLASFLMNLLEVLQELQHWCQGSVPLGVTADSFTLRWLAGARRELAAQAGRAGHALRELLAASNRGQRETKAKRDAELIGRMRTLQESLQAEMKDALRAVAQQEISELRKELREAQGSAAAAAASAEESTEVQQAEWRNIREELARDRAEAEAALAHLRNSESSLEAVRSKVLEEREALRVFQTRCATELESERRLYVDTLAEVNGKAESALAMERSERLALEKQLTEALRAVSGRDEVIEELRSSAASGLRAPPAQARAPILSASSISVASNHSCCGESFALAGLGQGPTSCRLAGAGPVPQALEASPRLYAAPQDANRSLCRVSTESMPGVGTNTSLEPRQLPQPMLRLSPSRPSSAGPPEGRGSAQGLAEHGSPADQVRGRFQQQRNVKPPLVPRPTEPVAASRPSQSVPAGPFRSQLDPQSRVALHLGPERQLPGTAVLLTPSRAEPRSPSPSAGATPPGGRKPWELSPHEFLALWRRTRGAEVSKAS